MKDLVVTMRVGFGCISAAVSAIGAPVALSELVAVVAAVLLVVASVLVVVEVVVGSGVVVVSFGVIDSSKSSTIRPGKTQQLSRQYRNTIAKTGTEPAHCFGGKLSNSRDQQMNCASSPDATEQKS